MIRERYLDNSEIRGLDKPVAQILEYSGAIDQDKLDHSFRTLCYRYPILRSRIYHDSRGYKLVCDDRIPKFAISELEILTCLDMVARSWDSRTSLAQLLLTFNQDGSGGNIALCVDHAITDGRIRHAFLNDLWQIYCSILQNSEPPIHNIQEPEFPESPLRLLTNRLGIDYKEYDFQYNIEPIPSLPANDIVDCHRIKLTKRQTGRIIGLAQRSDVSVHNVFSGVALQAQAHLERDAANTENGTVTLTCSAPVDLRTRVTPKVGLTETTLFVGPSSFPVVVSANDHTLDIGTRAREALNKSIAEKEPHYNLLEECTSQNEYKHLNFDKGFSHASISNIGLLPTFQPLPNAQITDYNRKALFALEGTSAIGYIFQTYSEVLGIEIVYPKKFKKAGERIASEVKQALVELSQN